MALETNICSFGTSDSEDTVFLISEICKDILP